MKNIVIINANGSKNIGDSAIRDVALSFIKEAIPDVKNISFHC